MPPRQLRVRASIFVALALTTAAGLLDLRASRRADEDWNLRVAQRAQLRWLSAYITAYGRTYGRPAFYLDSVVAHLDSATAARFNSYLVDLWGDRVSYWWNEQTFQLASAAGLTPDQEERMQDSVRALRIARGDTAGLFRPWSLSKRFDVREEYWWPVEARGRRNRLGQFTQAPVLNEPILIRSTPVPKSDVRDPPQGFALAPNRD